MLSRTHTGTFGTCGARTLPGEAYRATPLGGGLGFHPPTLNLPRRKAADHHLPKVPLNNGLSDYLHAARAVTTLATRLAFTARDTTIVISASSGAFVYKVKIGAKSAFPHLSE